MRGEVRAEGVELGVGRQVAVPEQPGGFLEGCVRGQLVDGEAGDDELARLAVDVAQARPRRHDTVESAGNQRLCCHSEDIENSAI